MTNEKARYNLSYNIKIQKHIITPNVSTTELTTPVHAASTSIIATTIHGILNFLRVFISLSIWFITSYSNKICSISLMYSLFPWSCLQSCSFKLDSISLFFKHSSTADVIDTSSLFTTNPFIPL